MREVRVNLERDSYTIYIESGIFPEIGRLLKRYPVGNKYCVIVGEKVNELYSSELMDNLRREGLDVSEPMVVPDGEEYKTWDTAYGLLRGAHERELDRDSVFIALGGGKVGDLTGFVALLYRRGVPFIQIPTTLLAQVDSSVGGKTAINIPEGKNLVGAFYQPMVVYVDPTLLKTLPTEEIITGWAEPIKHGIIDGEFFYYLEDNTPKIRDWILSGILDEDFLTETIARSCGIKARVVEKDEKEKKSLRTKLNYGHTIAHGIEVASDYTYPHGRAVAIGMRGAGDISRRMGYLSEEGSKRQNRLISLAGLPSTIPSNLELGRIKEALSSDKKVMKGKLNWVLARSIGEVFVTDEVSDRVIDSALEELRE